MELLQYPTSPSGSLKSGSMHGPVAEVDDFDFIDNLLDVLEAERAPKEESDADSDLECPEITSSVFSEKGLVLFEDLPEVRNLPFPAMSVPACSSAAVPARPSAMQGEQWNMLLNRFCEAGDDSIVDVMLDRFLGATGDIGSLMEAIEKEVQSKATKADRSSSKQFSKGKMGAPALNLSSIHDSPCLNTWDALVLSARELMHSARTCDTARSSRSKQGAGVAMASSPKSRAWAEGRVNPLVRFKANSAAAGQEAETVPLPPAQDETGSPQSVPPTEHSLSVLALEPEERDGIVARLSGVDDREVMRRFLLRVRRRCLASEEVGDSDEEAAALGKDAVRCAVFGDGDVASQSGDDDDRSASVWSVNSVSDGGDNESLC